VARSSAGVAGRQDALSRGARHARACAGEDHRVSTLGAGVRAQVGADRAEGDAEQVGEFRVSSSLRLEPPRVADALGERELVRRARRQARGL